MGYPPNALSFSQRTSLYLIASSLKTPGYHWGVPLLKKLLSVCMALVMLGLALAEEVGRGISSPLTSALVN